MHVRNDFPLGPLPRFNRELPNTSPLDNWQELLPGDHVHVLGETGMVQRAQVDILSTDGSVIWLRMDGIGHRSCHLRTDPIVLYRI